MNQLSSNSSCCWLFFIISFLHSFIFLSTFAVKYFSLSPSLLSLLLLVKFRRDFSTSDDWCTFIGVWRTANLLRSPGLFSVFWPMLTNFYSREFRFFLYRSVLHSFYSVSFELDCSISLYLKIPGNFILL